MLFLAPKTYNFIFFLLQISNDLCQQISFNYCSNITMSYNPREVVFLVCRTETTLYK